MTLSATRTIAVGAGLLLALAVPARAGSYEHTGTAPTKGTAAPDHFIKDAAVGGMSEVELGKLAEQRANRADVKSFGKRMVNDHSKANDELKSLAQKKNVSLPSDVDREHQAIYDRLSKLSGSDFDNAYMNEMLKDHREDVAEFERASKSPDPDVQAFASKTLPTLKEHLTQAEQVASSGSARNTGGR